MKKKFNYFKFVWICGIFTFLLSILCMIIDYKINYEYLTEKYLYFYNCDGSVCSSYVDDKISKDDLYSVYECGYEVCPRITKTLADSYVVLDKSGMLMLFDFRKNVVVSDDYDDYDLLGDLYFIISKDGKDGIMNKDGEVLINCSYDEFGYYQDGVRVGYNVSDVIVKKDNLYGIINISSGDVVEDFKYNEENILELLKIISG